MLKNPIQRCPGFEGVSVMVQRKMDNRLLSLSDNQNGPLVFELQLATRLLSGSTCRS